MMKISSYSGTANRIRRCTLLESDLKLLLDRLAGPQAEQAREAFDRLKKEGSSELSPEIQRVLDAALARKDPVVRDLACELLLEFDDVLAIPAALEAMIHDLGDDQSNLGFIVSQSIAAQPAAAQLTLLRFLEDPRPGARAAALWGLAFVDDPAIVPHLRTCLGDPATAVRVPAYGALAQYASLPDVCSLFQAGTSDPDPDVRTNVAIGLGSSGNADAVAPLLKLLADPQPDVRAHAAASLGWLGFIEVVAPLEEAALRDPDPDVRKEAETYVKKLRGKLR